jgi:hypothetical protein
MLRPQRCRDRRAARPERPLPLDSLRERRRHGRHGGSRGEPAAGLGGAGARRPRACCRPRAAALTASTPPAWPCCWPSWSAGARVCAGKADVYVSTVGGVTPARAGDRPRRRPGGGECGRRYRPRPTHGGRRRGRPSRGGAARPGYAAPPRRGGPPRLHPGTRPRRGRWGRGRSRPSSRWSRSPISPRRCESSAGRGCGAWPVAGEVVRCPATDQKRRHQRLTA